MRAFTVKNIPDNVYEALKKKAKIHHRSMNNEIIVCLEHYLKPKKIDTLELLQKAKAARELAKSIYLTDEELEQYKKEGRE